MKNERHVTRDTISVLAFLLLLQTKVFAASLDEQSYHLHQALNYMNIQAVDRCENASELAKSHLRKIDKVQNKELASMKMSAETLLGTRKIEVTTIESIRFRFSGFLEKNKVEHKGAWHREIEQNCPKAPRVE
ncbi:MAG: hypothetical protein IPJ84_05560 [Bdellovibrionales bacterium]|nr:hypothetical protein [Bdellovibrionales bacterium]